MTNAKPFLRWAGGKTRLLPKLLPFFPKKIRTYYEPFVGGGAVFFHLANEDRFKTAHINDKQLDVFSCYEALADDHPGVVKMLLTMKNNERKYIEHRAQFNDILPCLAEWRTEARLRAAYVIYLNKTCFNGLHRVNSDGDFNVPYGHRAWTVPDDVDNLINVGALLRRLALGEERLTIYGLDFEEMFRGKRIKKGDLVYLDPPYLPISATANFSGYTKGGFTREDHERLAALAHKLVEKGARVVASNADTPLARRLYKGFRLSLVTNNRSIAAKDKGRSRASEIIAVGG